MGRYKQFPVVDSEGVQASILAASRFLDDDPRKLIRLNDGRELLVPSQLVTPAADGTHRLKVSFRELLDGGREREAGTPDREIVIPALEEQIHVDKRRVETGRIRVHKSVESSESVVDEPLLEEGWDIERIPLNRIVEAPVESRYEGDTLILPVLEEVLVVEKRLVLREEMRITRRTQEKREPQTHILRREHLEVERVS